MPFDPRIEQPARTMLNHAMRRELTELSEVIRVEGNEVLAGVIQLCVAAAGYMAIEICERWPGDADLQQIAVHASKAATGLELNENEIYTYLSRVVLGMERIDDIFPAPLAGTLPLLVTANLLETFRPREMQWWEYLNQILNAVETAERVNLAVLPALMLRAYLENPVSPERNVGAMR